MPFVAFIWLVKRAIMDHLSDAVCERGMILNRPSFCSLFSPRQVAAWWRRLYLLCWPRPWRHSFVYRKRYAPELPDGFHLANDSTGTEFLSLRLDDRLGRAVCDTCVAYFSFCCVLNSNSTSNLQMQEVIFQKCIDAADSGSLIV